MNGSYSFTNLAPGTYQITARKSGFNEAQKSVTIRGADTVPLNFALSSTSVRPTRKGQTVAHATNVTLNVRIHGSQFNFSLHGFAKQQPEG